MTSEGFLQTFGHLLDAPNGVTKLRELILQLAVQGKLVEQDPDDEPANLLLNKIRSHRKRLEESKLIRKQKRLESVEDWEKYFNIPTHWVWVRLDEFGDWGAGATPNRSNLRYYGGSVKWLKSGELNDGLVFDSEEKITDLALAECSLRLNQPEDVLIAMYGATIGKVAILKTEATTNQAVCACTCFEGIFNQFLFLLLKAYKPTFTTQGAGGAQPNISRIKIVNTPVPLPPLEEQKRIVKKVDELMALVETLENTQTEKARTRSKLSKASFAALANAQNASEFTESWQHISRHFAELVKTQEDVQTLRQTILQLAVQGRLTEQRAEDGDAKEELELLQNRAKELKKNGTIRKIVLFKETKEDDIRFDTPNGWTWVQLNVLGTFTGGGTPSKSRSDFWNGDIFWVSPKDMKSDEVKSSEDKITQKALDATNLQLIPRNSLLIVARSGILKRFLPVARNTVECTVNQDLKVIIPYLPEMSQYLQLMLKGHQKFILSELVKTGTTVQSLKYVEFENSYFPLPPLAEQKRIVAKVDTLMAVCDRLEALLSQQQSTAERLVEAVVQGLAA